MKKLLLIFFLFNVFSNVVQAQLSRVSRITVKTSNNEDPPKGEDRYIYFDGYQGDKDYGTASTLMGVMDTRVNDIFRQITEVPNLKEWNKAHADNPIYPFVPKTPLLLGVKHTAKADEYSIYHLDMLSKDLIAYKLADKDSATVVALGINPENVKDYRYRVIINDSTELVPWTEPGLKQVFGAKQPCGFLGKFNIPGKELLVEVVNIHNYSMRDAVVFNWRNNEKAAITGIRAYKMHSNGDFVNLISGPKNHYSTKFDKATGAPLDMHFAADSFLNLNIGLKRHITNGYDIYWIFTDNGKETKTMIKGNFRDSVLEVGKQYFPGPGKYELLIYPTGTKSKQQETRIPYEVTSAFIREKKFSIMQALPYLGGVFLLLVGYYLYNKRRLRKLDQQKELADIKLSSVRAQLNPHFMFNALTSIQNLMNQQDNDGANHYLAKFADLTRRVLNATGHELISLEDELKIINDYLEIEQLRFGFGYTVDVDQAINLPNTEVPAMLMQPFIENAAKHGIGTLLDKGRIDINISKQNNDLLINIADNGKGFDTTIVAATGHGLKLSRERVALLNQVYKNQPIDLKIKSDATGTTITITLTAWF